MPLKNPTLHKVFIALRPDFFSNYHKEHITLAYYRSIKWDRLLEECSRLDNQLPAIIHPLHYSTWESNVNGKFHFGLIVDAPGSTVLDHLQMPHITLPVGPIYPALDALDPQIVDTLWIGKSVNGRYLWAKFNSKQIGVNYDNSTRSDAR